MKIVYIDSQNIHRALQDYHDWLIDWNRFFVYCKEKYEVDNIKIFFGYVKEYQFFYNKLEKIGYEVHY